MAKLCTGCKTELPEYRKHHYCTACATEMARARRARDPEKAREAARQYRLRLSDAEKAERRAREKAKRMAQRAERLAGRSCVECGAAIPWEYNARRVTCSDGCHRERAARRGREYHAANHTPRRGTTESSKLIAATKSQWWSEGHQFAPRTCRGCDREFVPASPPQRYCTIECRRDNYTAARYGMSGAEFRALLAAQAGACALCGSDGKGFGAVGPRRGDRLNVDHCHATGKVRGLLCGDCNTAIGRFGDDPARLRAAAEYLERYLEG